jgi:predicted amidophosphoribosyltransferase
MALSNCPKCGKTFNKLPNVKICRDCQDAEEALFETVYQYLRDNPKTTVRVVAEETGVQERLILEWFRSGRLAAHAPDVHWECEKCGAEIDRGRLCKRCAGETMGSIDDLLAPPDDAGSTPQQRKPSADFGHQLRSDKYAR